MVNHEPTIAITLSDRKLHPIAVAIHQTMLVHGYECVIHSVANDGNAPGFTFVEFEFESDQDPRGLLLFISAYAEQARSNQFYVPPHYGCIANSSMSLSFDGMGENLNKATVNVANVTRVFTTQEAL